MDHVECDSGGISSDTGFGDVSTQYAASYLKSFLPVYQMVNQSTSITSLADRYKAIKFAADASLAITANGATWSDALSKKLAEDCVDGSAVACDHPCDDRLSRSFEPAATSGAAALSQQLAPELDGVDFLCGPNVLIEKIGERSQSGGNSIHRTSRLTGESNFDSQLVCRPGRRSRCRSRLAVLRRVSLRNRSKRLLFKSSWKPRATLRKARSLARLRRTVSCSRQVETVELDQKFDSGIVALQRLIPGGSGMDASVLLDETADFLMFLKCQVQALQSIADAVDMQECFTGNAPAS